MKTIMKAIYKNLIIIIVGIPMCIILLSVPLMFWGIYENYAYRYVVEKSERFIYDKMTGQFLIVNGKSFYKDDEYIYAYTEGVFLIIDNRIIGNSGDIIAYIDKDNPSSRRLIDTNNKNYGGKIKIIFDNKYLTPKQIEIFNRLKDSEYSFTSQGLM